MVLQGTYSQDWLLYDTDWNWRLDSKFNGRSRCLADIGDRKSVVLGKSVDLGGRRIIKKKTVPTPVSPEYKDKIVAFEGGGYVAKGIYRPMQDCTMKSISVNNFCPVCKDFFFSSRRRHTKCLSDWSSDVCSSD